MPMIFCKVCGEKLPENARFCPKCGYRFENDQSAPPPFTLTKSQPAAPNKLSLDKEQEKPKLSLTKDSTVGAEYKSEPQMPAQQPLPLNNPQQSMPSSYPEPQRYASAPMTYDRNVPQQASPVSSGTAVKGKSKAPVILIIIVLIFTFAGSVTFAYIFFNYDKMPWKVNTSSAPSASQTSSLTSEESSYTSAAGGYEELDLRAICYDSKNYDYSFTTIAADNSFIEVDTNPQDIANYNSADAKEFIKELNKTFGFSDSLIDEMIKTNESDGSKLEENDDIRVKWRNDPETGLVVRYIRK